MSEYFGLIHHSVWSVITAHNLTPAKRDVTNVVSDQLQNVTVDNTADLQRLKRGIQIRRPKKKKMTPASRHASRAMMPEHTRSYNLCAPLATASAYTAMGFSLRRSATTTRTTASTSTSSSTVVQLRQTQQQLTPRRPSVTCVSSPRVSASCWCLAGTRVSVLSVLTLCPLCRTDVHCVVHLLTWLCVCTVDVYLANLNRCRS